ncbi:DNA-processing protein DprA [Alteromonas sp. KUL49]|uniref:DNA-processing protein DprA n=1 Tax=Alteromonas sp. KUL49 TaxID=2480798 RepID=UPI00102F1DF3|nr:DNA-processing protein DprA [Alteromonas sp. KUL49]TAP42058.1 DNA-protecting protein DprA [Alteromonas sp. KUL49]GEA09633.1 DNA protecting protein DprA [Alteromonas sp. KUL49]
MATPEVQSKAYSWLTLASSDKVNAKQWLESIAYTSLPVERFVASLPELVLAKQLPNEFNDTLSYHKVQQAKYWEASSPQHHIITYDDPNYPSVLKQLSQPPLVLFVTGNPCLLNRSQIAIVGSRNASLQGKENTRHFCRELVQQDIVITSGLALGIDGVAHDETLKMGGATIAVTATGPDSIYPKRHQRLANNIIDGGGALVTEFFPNTAPLSWHFPKRNRIIAALCMGTLVIEAKIKSGTLITAKLAADLGKEVFAVPGNILQPQSEGCHWLIQQGASLVTCVDDILSALPSYIWQPALIDVETTKKSEVNSLATDKLLDSVDYDITAIDVITERSAMPVQDAMAVLLEYELRGLVASVPGGYVKLRGK